MAQALDYSAGRLSAATIKKAGYVGVLRYLRKRNPSWVAVLTPAEYADLSKNNVDVALIYEDTSANRMLAGKNAGMIDGRWALQQAQVCGVKPIRCIYFACDFDAQPYQYPLVMGYLDGAASVLPDSVQVGLYAGFYPISAAGNHADWLWQTMAWSKGRIAPGIHVRQRIGQVTVGGIPCDVNDLMQKDWGQDSGTSKPDVPDVPPEPEDWLDAMNYQIEYCRDSSGKIYEANLLAGTYWHVRNADDVTARKKALAAAAIDVKSGTTSVEDMSAYGVLVGPA
ncbi:MAG: DUF1906 domain-containing protein [Mycobacterium sp.]|nr:DUF1906 domain-containing protein [Mycobacterium sp.]